MELFLSGVFYDCPCSNQTPGSRRIHLGANADSAARRKGLSSEAKGIEQRDEGDWTARRKSPHEGMPKVNSN